MQRRRWTIYSRFACGKGKYIADSLNILTGYYSSTRGWFDNNCLILVGIRCFDVLRNAVMLCVVRLMSLKIGIAKYIQNGQRKTSQRNHFRFPYSLLHSMMQMHDTMKGKRGGRERITVKWDLSKRGGGCASLFPLLTVVDKISSLCRITNHRPFQSFFIQSACSLF